MNLPDLQTLAIEPLDGGIAVLRVNRPDRMNAQNVTMFGEYGIAARALRDSGLRALILTGAGDRAFCAGFDLDELDAITRLGVREFLKFLQTAAGGITAIRHLPFTLSRLVGPGRAAEIGYTGRVVGAEEAVRIGLANRVVPTERLFDEALAMATAIAAHPAGGVRLSKRAIQRNQGITSFAAALELENRGQALLTRTGDLPAALAARAGRR
jgi:enoyl-CoA hydratase/carnithine racemase